MKISEFAILLQLALKVPDSRCLECKGRAVLRACSREKRTTRWERSNREDKLANRLFRANRSILFFLVSTQSDFAASSSIPSGPAGPRTSMLTTGY